MLVEGGGLSAWFIDGGQVKSHEFVGSSHDSLLGEHALVTRPAHKSGNDDQRALSAAARACELPGPNRGGEPDRQGRGVAGKCLAAWGRQNSFAGWVTYSLMTIRS